MNFNEIAKIILPLSLDERAKVIENVVRYLAMLHLHIRSYDYAIKQLKQFETNSKLLFWLDNDRLRLQNICLGVACELRFYCRFWRILNLVPTLDAGCAFDFVGRTPKNAFLRIDVTHNIECKKQKDADQLFGGPSGWRKLFAQVNDEGCRLYNEKFKPTKPVHLSSSIDAKMFKAPSCGWDLEYFVARHRWLRFVELGGAENLVLAELATAQRFVSVSSGMLYAQAMFYIRYRQILNLVPALSCGDRTDFVGESEGQVVRYYVLTETQGYGEKCSGYLARRTKNGFRYKVVVFNGLTCEFRFHDVDDLIGIEPNWGF